MAATRESQGREELRAFQEQAVRLGAQENLVGILSVPTVVLAERVAVVVLNAGVLHRVGPHRLHVNLARRIATLGFSCLRLDLAGIGDSAALAGTQSFRESAVADTRTAMNDLGVMRKVERFVLFGLCSGADNALATAASDDRVVGLVLVDPPTYATRRSRARRLGRRVGALGARGTLSWAAAMARRQLRQRVEAALGPHVRATEPPSEGRETPPIEEYRGQLHSLLDRGVKILAVYSGGMGERYNDADQVFENFPELRGRLDHVYFGDANHMFTERASQALLVDAVTAWVGRHFPPSAR